MAATVADPAGLIARIPELEALTDDASVRRKIERGDPHGLYRTLFWANLTGRMRRHRDTVRLLLSRRRLFLTPIQSAPSLFTYNGCGLTVYGNADRDGNDGTYILTHYIVLVFVPLFPLRQYLVRDGNPSGRGARSWGFIGKVPFSPLAFLWNRLLALAIAASVVVGATSAFRASRYHEVHFLNATSIPVRVAVAGQSLELGPGTHDSRTVHVGKQRVTVTRGDGAPVEAQDIDVHTGGKDVQIFNVLGAGLVYSEKIYYRSEGARADDVPRDQPAISCGERFVTYDEADFVFTEPAKSLSASKSSGVVTRRHVDFMHEPEACVGYLAGQDQLPLALTIAVQVAESSGYPYRLTGAAATMLDRAFGTEASLAFIRKALAVRPDDVDLHRLYQSIGIAGGKRPELLQAYQKRRDEKPDDPDRGYLLARLSPPSAAAAPMADLVQRHPQHVAARRAHAFDEFHVRHFDAAITSLRKLFELQPSERGFGMDMLVRALVATGKDDEALRELEAAFADKAASHAELAELYARVARAAGGKRDPEALLDKMAEALSPTALRWHRVRGDLPVEATAPPASDGETPGMADSTAIMVAARSAPDQALELAARGSEAALRALDEDTWALLFCEAARRDAGSAVTRALAGAGFRSKEEVSAIRDFTVDGKADAAGFEEASFEMRAAAELARSRSPALPAAERARLLAAAKRDDLLHGVITTAAGAWPHGR